MWTTVISAAFGLVSSFAGPIIKLWTQKTDQKHEIAMTKLNQGFAERMKGAEWKQELNLTELVKLFELVVSEQRAVVEQQKALLTHDKGLGDEMVAFHGSLAQSPSWAVKNVIYPIMLPFMAAAVTLRYFTRAGVTYMVAGTWALVHYAKYVSLTIAGEKWYQAVQNMWTEEDSAVFGYVLGFWFGERLQAGTKRLAGWKAA